MEALAQKFAAMDDAVAAIDEALDSAVARFVDGLKDFEPHRLIEVARMAYLPWSHPGQTVPTPEATAAHVELLALIALAAANGRDPGEEFPEPDVQAMSHFVSEAADHLNAMLELAQLRGMEASDSSDTLLTIASRLRSSLVFVRQTSYTDMVRRTMVELFDGDPRVRASLNTELGFDASDALAVLTACHDVQLAKMNARGEVFANEMNVLMSQEGAEPTTQGREAFLKAVREMFEPNLDSSTVGVDELVTRSGLPENRVRSVIERFHLNLASAAPVDVVNAFMAGNNPMRAHPLVVTSDGRSLLPHDVLAVEAVKENLEQHLKNSSAWDLYVKHRGSLLETRTRAALARVLPGASFRDGFEYYVPADDYERAAGDPTKYTKRVEGDHLVVLDDVALIAEDKAVALSALSKGGKTARMRTDLTGIITKAAEQAGRLQDVIERDGGVRVEGEGWVDLSGVREIHTIAVSLDDLTSITTATAELLDAKLLDPDSIPWTVSLHDLELITELIDRPAEFLLYLRRRLNPKTTELFFAVDELDLFLYFLEAGLWVQPDPELMRDKFPWMGLPTTAERRRFRAQIPALITTQTDSLDAWYFAKQTPGAPPMPKPTMEESPLAELVDELHTRGQRSWLSIGATLLEPAIETQRMMARYPQQLLDAPAPTGRGRSLTMPIASTVNCSHAWLMVWATRPRLSNPDDHKAYWCAYLRAKKHQLRIPRGVLFVYEEVTGDLVDVCYDGSIGELPAELEPMFAALHPPSFVPRRLPPSKKRSRGVKPKRKRRK